MYKWPSWKVPEAFVWNTIRARESELTLRLAFYRQSVHLGAKPLEDHDQRFFFGELLR
jgi:hypothetical protein